MNTLDLPLTKDKPRWWPPAFLAEQPLPPLGEPSAEAEFDLYARRQSYYLANGMAVMLLLVHLVLYATDPYVFARDPVAFAAFRSWRVSCTLFLLTMIASGALVTYQSRTIWKLGYFAAFGTISLTYFWLGKIGGMEGPWFYSSFMIGLFTFFYLVPLGKRIILQIGMYLSFLLPYWLQNLDMVESEYFWPGMVATLFSFAIYVPLGHVLYRLQREHYLRAHIIANQRAALEDHSRILTEKLDERTRELTTMFEKIRDVRNEERQRLGRDLHDELGQLLTALQSETYHALSSAAPLPEREAALRRIQQLLAAVGNASHRVIGMLQGKAISPVTFEQMVQELVDTIEQRTALRIEFVCQLTPEPLSAMTGLSLFRIIQEALTNIERHSQATQAEVVVHAEGGSVSLLVKDNGVGMPGAPKEGRHGLEGLCRRVEELGGELHLQHEPGAGVEIAATIPLRLEAEAGPTA